VRALIARDSRGNRICGPCDGTSTAFACRTCGIDCAPVADRQCPRCHLNEQVEAFFRAVPEPLTSQLRPLRAVLLNTDSPQWIGKWLTTSTTAAILRGLIEGGVITHDRLDQLPQDKSLRHLRDILTHVGVLPERDERLHQLGLWLNAVTDAEPASRARVIDAYGRWAVLHRVRRERRGQEVAVNAAGWARHRITTARDFLTWLDHSGTVLSALTQNHIESWLNERPSAGSYDIDTLIVWLNRRNLLTNEVSVPARKRRATVNPLDDQTHWQHLERCLHDNELPLDLRCAGLLMLLYGQRITDIVQLTHDRLVVQDAGIYLTLNRQGVHLAPPIGALLVELLETREPSPLGRAAHAPPRWLFPGHRPGRPVAPHAMTRRLHAIGITVTPSRLTALLHMTEDLPSAVVAELLGYDIQTTDKWSRIQKHDWARYLKDRQIGRNQEHNA
jgi:hypothetical protein